MSWFSTYIGKLIAFYAAMLMLIVAIAVPSFYYRHQQQQLALQAMAEPVCRQCIYDDLVAENSQSALLTHLDSRFKTDGTGYLLFSEDQSFKQGNLDIAPARLSMALQEHFAFTDIPYNVSHDMETDTMETLFKLKSGSFLLIEEQMSGNPESAHYLISQLEAKISQNAIVNSVIIGVMALLAFTFTALMGWKMHQKINQISQTSATIIANMDLSKRIPMEHQGNEFNQLAGQLNLMLDAIESRVNDVTAMSNMLAHELRTPLTRFKHKLLLASEEGLGLDNLYDHLNSDLDKIMATFDASLRICRLESGNARVHLTPVDMVDLVDNASDLLAPVAAQNRQVITTTVTCKQCLADSQLLAQALINLLENAIRYAGDGAAIHISTIGADQAFDIVVSDTGQGMSAEQLSNATGLYVKGPHTSQGVGLGLHMVKAIAAAHQGRIELKNKKNGFEARLILPATIKTDSRP